METISNEKNNKEYYKQAIDEQKRFIRKARTLAENMLDRLIKQFHDQPPENIPEDTRDTSKQNPTNLWGEKESTLSALTRIVQLLCRLVPIEQKLLAADVDSASEDELKQLKEDSQMTMDELKILEHYIEQRKEESQYQ